MGIFFKWLNSLLRGCGLKTLEAAFATHPHRGEGGDDDSACSLLILHCWCISALTYRHHLWEKRGNLFQLCTRSFLFWPEHSALLSSCLSMCLVLWRGLLSSRCWTEKQQHSFWRKTSVAPSNQSRWLWSLLPNTKQAIACIPFFLFAFTV